MPATATKKRQKKAPATPKANGQATISATQARELVKLDKEVAKHARALDRAQERQRELRDELKRGVPISRKPEERKKRIRACVVDGIYVRICPSRTGDRFSLKIYTEAGHEITPAMQEAITPGKSYDRWTVKPPK